MQRAPDSQEIRPLTNSATNTRRILGVDFYTGSIENALEMTMKGGLILAPSGPGLAGDLVQSHNYRLAVQSADIVLTDSGAMVLLWFLFTGEQIPRHSGLKFLRAILSNPDYKKPGAIFWVMPSSEEASKNCIWLESQGFSLKQEDIYIAPAYEQGPITDQKLLSIIGAHQPRLVMITVGGGVQERLGHYLKSNLSYRPAILCIGAAIAFLTGGQAKIPPLIDRLMLGWLFRIIYSPRRFAIRYWNALAIIPLLWRYRDRMPPLAD